jgi:hypothetical protein
MRDDDPLLAVTVPSLVGVRPHESALGEEPGAAGDGGEGDDVAPSGTVPTAPYRLFLDLWRGAIDGAYAIDDLHAPGAFVWILLGFVPGVGTLAALRDGYYSLEVREWGAFLLNLLGLIPFVKGFANIAQLASLHRLSHTAHVTHQVARVARHQRALRRASRSMQRSAAVATGSAHAGGAVVLAMSHESGPRHNGWAWPAALLALVTFALSPMIVVGSLLLAGGQSLLTVSAPPPIVVAAAVTPVVWCVFVLLLAAQARRVARHMRGRPFARPGVSSTAFWLGLGALVLTGFATGMALLVTFTRAHP